MLEQTREDYFYLFKFSQFLFEVGSILEFEIFENINFEIFLLQLKSKNIVKWNKTIFIFSFKNIIFKFDGLSVQEIV